MKPSFSAILSLAGKFVVACQPVAATPQPAQRCLSRSKFRFAGKVSPNQRQDRTSRQVRRHDSPDYGKTRLAWRGCVRTRVESCRKLLDWKRASATVLLLLSASALVAAAPASIRGVITDPVGAVIPGARVQLLRDGKP
ncbi:MAG: carboxypeptidase-like regulatory domain-containing protein, partial [Candidatus Angelobacter sp.]